VRVAVGAQEHGIIDNWLRHIKDIHKKYQSALQLIEDEQQRLNTLCEFNVIEQVKNVCHTTIVQRAWARGQSLDVHGWIYDLRDGLLQDLRVSINTNSEVGDIYRFELSQLS
jgi:carbonic anhydrase